MTSAISKTILSIGISHPPPASLNAALQVLGITASNIGPLVAASLQKTKDAGYIIIPCYIPGAESEVDNALSIVEKTLEEKGKELDGINVGFGLRGTPEYTVVFETVMRLVVERCPGVRIGFNARPDDVYEAVVRNFPL